MLFSSLEPGFYYLYFWRLSFGIWNLKKSHPATDDFTFSWLNFLLNLKLTNTHYSAF